MNALTDRSRNRNKSAAKGFSLVEVLVVTMMLGTVALSLIGVFAYGFKLVSKTKQVTMATQVAQVQVERLRNTDYDAIPIAEGAPSALSAADYPFLFASGDNCSLDNGQQTITVAQGIDENLKRLDIAITWNNQGQAMRKDIVTYIAKDGISRR
jgi:type II secretory pathway pseudopilin PulG